MCKGWGLKWKLRRALLAGLFKFPTTAKGAAGSVILALSEEGIFKHDSRPRRFLNGGTFKITTGLH